MANLLKRYPRDNQHIVISWGCPRGGSTLLKNWIGEGKGFFHAHLHEGTPFHPCQSTDGLLQLLKTFRHENLSFVRIYRDPFDILESFMSAMLHEHLSLDAKGISDNTVERAVEFIVDEYLNFELQKKSTVIMGTRPPLEFRLNTIEINFNRLHLENYQMGVCALIAANSEQPEVNEGIFYNYINKTFMKIPVRSGRLSHDVKETFTTPDAKKLLKKRLKAARIALED